MIAAILFFMERDNDTFKNLRTIPVTSTQMVLAKIIVLFLFGIVFCVASTIATILCGFGTLEVYGIGYKLFLAVETGIFITAGTLPLIVLVVFFSKTYVFSICVLVTGIVRRFLNVSLSRSIKNRIAAITPIMQGSKNWIPYPNTMLNSPSKASARSVYRSIIEGVVIR